VGIEGVDDQLQQLADFSLKFAFRHRPSLSPKNRRRMTELRRFCARRSTG
jgi:hypothetical protein